MLDLDHFKNFNDQYGHTSGDQILIEISRLIQKEIREIDLAARYGSEEFLFLLAGTGMADAIEAAERIWQITASTEFSCGGKKVTSGITVSLGVSTWDSDSISQDILIAKADTALYRAKTNGRNRVESWISSMPRSGEDAA